MDFITSTGMEEWKNQVSIPRALRIVTAGAHDLIIHVSVYGI